MGGTGDDLLDGGAGADTIDGGGGIDTVSYASATAGVIVRLDDEWWGPSPYGSSSDGDFLIFVENVIGSDFDDVLSGGGSSVGNVIDGGAGDDTLNGGGGPYTLTGGEGSDTFVLDPADPVSATITDLQMEDQISIVDAWSIPGYSLVGAGPEIRIGVWAVRRRL